MKRLGGATACLAAVGLSAGCGAIAGLGDDFFTLPDVDAATDAPSPDAELADAPSEAAPAPDASALDAPDKPDGIVDAALADGSSDAPADSPDDVVQVEAGGDSGGGSENCTNGKDDNGNGLVDCEDPECQAGFTCGSPLLPSGNGWTLGLFDATGRPACPSGYSNSQSVMSNLQGTGPATCACQCDTNTPAYCAGTAMHANNGGGSNACPNPPNAAVVPYGGEFVGGVICALPNTAQPIAAGLKYATAGDSHTVPAACTPHDVATIPAVTANHGETCAALRAGTGCGGGACVPRPTGGFQICAFKAGAACPNGLVQTSAHVGDGVNDPRGCGGCACGSSDLQCAFGGIQFFPNGTCAPGPGAFFVAAGQCVPANPPGNFGSLGVTGSQNANSTQCSPTGNSVSNNLTATPAGAELTICCPP